MSFGFRVGVPGMRVRVSTRGVRASMGPRIARVNMGSGRTTVSTGMGPFFASTALAPARRRTSQRTTTRRAPNRPAAPSAAQLARAQRAAQRAQEEADRDAAIQVLRDLRVSSTSTHLQRFPVASRPAIPLPAPVPADAVLAEAIALRLRGIGRFARSDRAAARAQAEHDARNYVAAEQQRLATVHRQLVGAADDWWAALLANDEDTVCEAVNTAFADNPSAGCAVGVQGSTLSIVLRQQDIDSLPNQTPGVTSAGRPTLKALTKRDRVTWWLHILASNLAATCMEALAVAPSITDVSVAVLTRMSDTQRLGIVAYGNWSRRSIDNATWRHPDDAWRILDLGADFACSVRTTASGNFSPSIRPLSVDNIPALATLLAANTVDDANPLAELDSALANSPDPAAARPLPDPYRLTPLAEWLAAQQQSLPVPAPQGVPNSGPTVHSPLAPGQTVVLPEPAIYQLELAFAFAGADADLTLLLLDDRNRVGSDDDFIFYNHHASSDNSVRLLGKSAVGAGAVERAVICPAALPPRVRRVVISANMDVDAGRTFSALDAATLTATSSSAAWSFTPAPEPTIRAIVLAEIYRHTDPAGRPLWKLRAVGQGWADGLAGLAREHGVDIDD